MAALKSELARVVRDALMNYDPADLADELNDAERVAVTSATELTTQVKVWEHGVRAPRYFMVRVSEML